MPLTGMSQDLLDLGNNLSLPDGGPSTENPNLLHREVRNDPVDPDALSLFRPDMHSRDTITYSGPFDIGDFVENDFDEFVEADGRVWPEFCLSGDSNAHTWVDVGQGDAIEMEHSGKGKGKAPI
jgi:hypothetical protein